MTAVGREPDRQLGCVRVTERVQFSALLPDRRVHGGSTGGKDGALDGLRRGRQRKMGAIVAISLVGGLALATSPAAGQNAESFEPAAVTGTIDPASIIDVAGFSERAVAWAAAQVDHRAAAIERANALAAETKANEDAELARIEDDETARRLAEEETRRRQAEEEEARRAAEAASTSTTTAPPAGDGSDETGDSGAGDGPEVGPAPGGPSAEQWHALRQCESNNNYRAVSSTGRYRGAYQFSVATWDWLAGSRYPELIGVDPIDASNADQDKMAAALYAIYGKSPWPVCGEYLP